MSVESYVLSMRLPDVPDVDDICNMLKLPGGAPIPFQDTFDLVAEMLLRGEIPDIRMKEDDFDDVWRPLFRQVTLRLKTEPNFHTPFEVIDGSMCYTVDIAKNLKTLIHCALRALKNGPVSDMTTRVKNDTKAKNMMASLYIVNVIYIALRLQFDIEMDRIEALQL